MHQIDQEFSEIVEDVLKQNAEKTKIDSEYIGRVIQDLSFGLILSLYDYFMATSTKDDTKKFLLGETDHNNLCNAVQKLIGYEEGVISLNSLSTHLT